MMKTHRGTQAPMAWHNSRKNMPDDKILTAAHTCSSLRTYDQTLETTTLNSVKIFSPMGKKTDNGSHEHAYRICLWKKEKHSKWLNKRINL
ncbi:hypothetical protein GNY06_07175 [Elizabethkingia argentiflava]|uniref:Uncharacterized protein n=1 Tax=Elizabethkingia argenteiflava TaxID=2681556 RepID=A0A845PU43_9FLAO|nr:hypothetical protein [Elizabethkingia argenteiflava]NAW51165.1 hypothetical protein [Elizabethkingia argenteiflava]